MRARWNIRVLHMPDPARVPFKCHVCDWQTTRDLTAETPNLLIGRVEDGITCGRCGTRGTVDLNVSRDRLRWRDGE